MKTKQLFSRIGFGYVMFFVVSLGMQFLLVFFYQLAAAFLLHQEVRMGPLMLISQFAMYGCAFPLLWLYMQHIPSWEMKEKQKLTIGKLLLVAIFCFGITYLGNIIGQVLMYLFSRITNVAIENPVNSMIDELSLPSLFFYVVIVAPLMEEVIFRKLLIDRIIPYGQKTAVIVSGVAFGLFHGNFYQFFYACTIGMVFAYIYSKTGTIRYGVFLHALINFVGGFIASILQKGMEREMIIAILGMAGFGFFVFATLITAIVFIFVFGPRIKFFPAWRESAGPGLWRKILLTPGTLAYLAACGVMFIYY